jgi:hypothetical protein
MQVFPKSMQKNLHTFLRVNVPRGLGIIGFSGCLHTFARFFYFLIIKKKKKRVIIYKNAGGENARQKYAAA